MARRSRQSDAPKEPAKEADADVVISDRTISVAPVFEVRGSIDGLQPDGYLHGWAWSPTEPFERRRLAVLVDGEPVVQTIADLERPDLATAGIGDGRHAFSVYIPDVVRSPGLSITFALRDLSSGAQAGGELVVEVPDSAPAPHAILVGNVDHVTNDGWVAGWCWYPDEPARRADLAVLVNGVEIGRARAQELRGDLQQAGVGDGRYGFSFALPWEILSRTGTLTVTVRDAFSFQQLGSDAVVRIGAQLPTEDRVAMLERQVRLLRAELGESTQRERTDEHQVRALFETVATFFRELAANPSTTVFASAGLRKATEAFGEAHPPLTLAVPAEPKATVVILPGAPADNVYRAVAALQATGADALADIVVLDDGMHGGDLILLPTVVRNIRYHRAPAGRPAFAALPDTLRDGRGSCLVCLSPHVTAEPGCVATLIETLMFEPDAVVVAARVDRREGGADYVGASLLPDFSVSPRTDAASDSPGQAFLQPTDIADPRAFAIRRDAGLMQHALMKNWPGAFETPAGAVADLCLAARAAGGTILFQPAAVVTVASEDETQGLADTSEMQRLALRWRDTPPDPRQPLAHALVIDAQLPRGDRDAGSVVIFEFMQVLRRLGWQVSFAPADGSFADRQALSVLERRGIHVVRPPGYDSVGAFLRMHGATLDLVLACRYEHARMFIERVRELAPNARFVFAPVDLHFLREQREAAFTRRRPRAQTREEEMAVAKAADITLVHSDVEHDLLAREIPSERIRTIRWIARPQARIAPYETRRGICFVGAFRHRPNVDAVEWFTATVMPILHQESPDVVFHIVGPDAPPAITALAGDRVVVHGWIADLDAFLATMRVSVAPLRYGAGFKGKVATSLAAGLPLVATSVAIEGTGLADGDGVRVADDAQGFARAIVALHSDPIGWAVQSARGLERCAALYSEQRARAAFRELLGSLGLPFARR